MASLPAGPDSEKFTVGFEKTTDVVEPGKAYTINAAFGVAEGAAFHGTRDFLGNLDPEFAYCDYEVIIRYQDVEGRHYVSWMSMGKSRTRLGEVRPA